MDKNGQNSTSVKKGKFSINRLKNGSRTGTYGISASLKKIPWWKRGKYYTRFDNFLKFSSSS